MLELRPNCECCDCDLPPESTEARICSYECTFCANCVDDVLHNVCPNCGGGLVPRPLRPRREHRAGVSLARQGASTERVQSRFQREEMVAFAAGLKHLDPGER